jgi:ABC-type Fe3+ transport system permease subunit
MEFFLLLLLLVVVVVIFIQLQMRFLPGGNGTTIRRNTQMHRIFLIGKEVKPSIATVCVCALLLHVKHYNMFRPIWAIIR